MVTINTLNYELIIHNYFRFAERHGLLELFPRLNRGGKKGTSEQPLLPKTIKFTSMLPNQNLEDTHKFSWPFHLRATHP